MVYVFYCNLMQRHLKFSVSPLMSLNSDWSHAPQFFLKPSDRPKSVRSPRRQITTGTLSVGTSEVHVNAVSYMTNRNAPFNTDSRRQPDYVIASREFEGIRRWPESSTRCCLNWDVEDLDSLTLYENRNTILRISTFCAFAKQKYWVTSFLVQVS